MILKPGVIYLQKDKLQIYSPYVGNVLEMRFTTQMIRDLDVIDIELLENSLKAFVTNGKISPSSLVFVLADSTYFVKDFVPPAAPKVGGAAVATEVTKDILQKQADEFVEHVPFDNVVSKTLPLKNGLRVCATNKDFYEAVAIAFEHLGFSLVGIIPALVLGEGLGARPVMDPAMAISILQKANTVKEYDLLNQQVYQPQLKLETEEMDEVELERMQGQNQYKKTNKKRLFALTGIFASLLIVLVIVYVQSQTPPTPPKQPALASGPAAPAPTAIVNPAIVTPTSSLLSDSATPSALETSTQAVQILNTANSATTAEALRVKLNTYKFKSVSTQTQTSIGSSSTVVSFAPSTSQAVRNVVLDAVKQVKTDITVQDKQDSVFAITIILGE